MAFTVAIAQPTGVGSAVGTKGLSGAWLTEPVIIALPPDQHAYAVSIVDESTGVGAILTGGATAAASLTAAGKGSVRLLITYRATSVSRWETGYRVVRFQRDADGTNLETVAPALLETPAETAEARGYADIMDDLVQAVSAGGDEPRPYAPRPALQSASVNAATLTTLVATWDRAVVHASLVGITLDPPDAEIVDVASGGEGTTTTTYTLDTDLEVGSTYALEIADVNGVRSALGAVAAAADVEFTVAPLEPPQFVRATIVTEDRDRLRLRWSEACTLVDVSLITLTVETGTARTVVSLASGDDTAEHIYALSGNLDAPTRVLVNIAAGAVRAVGNDAAIEAVAIHAREAYTATALTVANGFDVQRFGRTAGASWPTLNDDPVVFGTLSGAAADVANGYEGTSVKRFEKSAPDQMYVSTPGSNQVGAFVAAAAHNLWTVAIPQSFDASQDNAANAFYNNEGWIGGGVFGVAIRGGAAIGADSARAQCAGFSGGYSSVETPIQLMAPSCVFSRHASGTRYARTDLSPTINSAAQGDQNIGSGITIGTNQTTGGRDADVDFLAIVSAKSDLPAYKQEAVFGCFINEDWGDFLEPRPSFPRRVMARVGAPVTLSWKACVAIMRDDAIECAADVGTSDANGWSWTPSGGDVGEHTVTVTITDANDDRILRVCKFRVIVIAATGTGVVRVAYPGDSNMANAVIPARVRTTLTAMGYTVTNLGTLGSNPDKHDGTGGTSWDETLTGTDSAAGGTPSQWSPDGLTYDIAAWVAALGATPTHVVENYGINDISAYYSSIGNNPTARAAHMATVMANKNAFNAALKAAIPGVVIITIDPLPVNDRQSAWTAVSPTLPQWGEQKLVRFLKEAQDADMRDKEPSNEYQCASACIDTVTGYPTDNNVHPETAALQLVGDQVAWCIAETLA